MKKTDRIEFSSAREEWQWRITRWNSARAGFTTPVGSRAFWDSFSLWEEYEKHTNYPGMLLNLVTSPMDSNTTVLDVGAGTGSIAIPLAKIARSVTAVEPSAAQVERLKRKLGKEKCANVRIIQQNWQEVDLSQLGLHDIVIAGYSLFMEDIVPALRKLIDGASKRIFIIHLHSHGLQTILEQIKEDEIQAPDAKLLLRVLEEIGISATKKIIYRAFSLPLELQLQMFRYAQRFTDEQIAILEEKLRKKKCLFLKDGKVWLRRWYRDAILSINPAESRQTVKP